MSKNELLNIMRIIEDITRTPKVKHYRTLSHAKHVLNQIHTFAAASVELAEK